MPTVKSWLYLLLLAAAFIFYIFYIGWFAYFMLAILIVIPFINLLISFPGFIFTKLDITAPAFVQRGDTIDINMRFYSFHKHLGAGASVHYTVKNVFTGEILQKGKLKYFGAYEKTEIISITSARCGNILVESKMYVYDLMALFIFPKRRLPLCSTTVLPIPTAPLYNQHLENISKSHISYIKAENGYAEEYELREYRPGDQIRNMHWKLTAKFDKPIMREPITSDKSEIFITFDISANTDTADSVLALLYWFTIKLLNNENHHTICWNASGKYIARKIKNEYDLNQAISALLSISAKSLVPPQKDVSGIWFIVREGIIDTL